MSFKLVEDFESFAANAGINGQTNADKLTWKTAGSGAEQQFKVVSLYNQKLLWCNPASKQRAFLPLSKAVSPQTTCTLFFSIGYTNTGTASFGIGLSEDAEPPENRQAVTMEFTTDTDLKASANHDSDGYQMKPNAWYKVWMVLDLGDASRSQTDHSYRVYYREHSTTVLTQMRDSKETGAKATDFLLQDYAAAALNSFVVFGDSSQPFYVNDIYIDTSGENLSDPSTTLDLVYHGKSDYKIVYEAAIPTGTGGFEQEIQTRSEAARILKEYILKSTGAELQVVTKAADYTDKSARYIFVGDSQYARALGVDVRTLADETYRMSVRGNHLILAGPDDPKDPWNMTPGYGWIETPTLYAVAQFLHDYVGARWYWPGSRPVAGDQNFGEKYTDLRNGGLVVSKTLQVMKRPTCVLREITLGYSEATLPVSRLKALGYDDAFIDELVKRHTRWIRLNRLGVKDQIWHQHHWWKLMPKSSYGDPGTNTLYTEGGTDKFFAYYAPRKEGEEDYDPWSTSGRVRGGKEKIIAEYDNGNVVMDPKTGKPKAVYVQRNQLCVSGRAGETDPSAGEEKPEIIERVFAEVERLYAKLRAATIAPNDDTGHCACDSCLEKDEFNGEVDTEAAQGRNIGRRMFWFFNEVARRVAQTHPKLWLTTYAYGGYLLPPELKDKEKYHPDFLQPKLIVYDTHNGYGFGYWDAWKPVEGDQTKNVQEQSRYRFSRWGTTTRTPAGAEAGHVAIYSGPYFINSAAEFIYKVPMASKEPIVDALARQIFHRYMGGFFEFNGLGHWPDRYMTARLLWDSVLSTSTLEGPTGYISQLGKKADLILDDYYTGLFGAGAGPYVKEFYRLIGDQVKNYVREATDNSDGKAGRPFEETVGKMLSYTLFEKVFAPIEDRADSLLLKAALRAKSHVGESAHLHLVSVHWQFAKLTIKFFRLLDAYNSLYKEKTEHTGDQLQSLRDFWQVMSERSTLVDEVSSDPNLCLLAFPPATVLKEYKSIIHLKTIISKGKSEAVLINMEKARRITQTILAVQNDAAEKGWPLGANALAVRRPAAKIYLEALVGGVSTPDYLWLDWFGRVEVDAKSKTYLIVLNDSGETQAVELRIKNVDPNKGTRSLHYYDRNTAAETAGGEIELSYVLGSITAPPTPYVWPQVTFSYPDQTNKYTESALVTDTATFKAAPGLTLLVLNDSNFAPHGEGFRLILGNGDDAPSPCPYSSLKDAYFRIFPAEDDFLINGSCAYFYITDEKGASRGKMVGYIQTGATKYDEMISSRRWDGQYDSSQNIQSYVINTPGSKTTYHVYAAIYDSDHIKHITRDENDAPFRYTLEVEA